MNRLERLIAKHEGYRKHIYEDTHGNKTIGYGLNLAAGLPEDEARLLMKRRINKLREELKYKIPVFNSLSERRKDVLINVAYNVGLEGLMEFRKMLAAISEGNFSRAKHELLDSKAARELHNRYGELAEMLLKG